MYRLARSPSVGLSNSTSANSTPPRSSATPSSIKERTKGVIVRQEGHQDAVQRVIKARREEAERRVKVSSSVGERTLQHTSSARLLDA